MVTQRHTSLLPSLEDGAHVDGSALAVLLTDSPVLLEGLGAVDGGLLVTSALVEVVGGTGVLEGAALLGLGAGVVVTAEEDELEER